MFMRRPAGSASDKIGEAVSPQFWEERRAVLGPVYLLDLASRQAEWLSVRQAAIAGNVSNADTPGYKARDIEPFVDVLDQTRLAMAATRPGHIGTDSRGPDATTRETEQGWNVTPSGNSVSLEEELVRSGEVSRAFALNRGVIGAFHTMLMTSARGR